MFSKHSTKAVFTGTIRMSGDTNSEMSSLITFCPNAKLQSVFPSHLVLSFLTLILVYYKC
jgi:hypothetical protein